jgi:serpin B
MTRLVALSTALALIVAACGDGASTSPPTDTAATTTAAPEPGPVEVVRASVSRARVTDVTPAEMTSLVDGNTRFALDVFAAATADGGNVIVSPFSVAAALTMAYAGARGDTATQMAGTLALGLADDRIHAARNQLDLTVTTPGVPTPDDDRDPFTIAIANSLWGHNDYPFLDEFLELLAVNYDAGLNLVDFVTATEQARVAINDWVEEHTNGRIEDLIPQGVITTLTRLVIVNAIWFKASWQHQFDPANTTDGPFTLLDGSTVTVPLMNQRARVTYHDGDGYTAVRLPYAGDAAMEIILPDTGLFEEVSRRFGRGEIGDIPFTDHEVTLTMPKWEFSSDVGLKQILQDLGMVAAFTEPSLPDGADFTGITAARELFIHDVLHKAFIAVDEEGTEAAAATAVIIGLESMPAQATMAIDRPFIFTIEHSSTGEVLFVGQVVDPSR